MTTPVSKIKSYLFKEKDHVVVTRDGFGVDLNSQELLKQEMDQNVEKILRNVRKLPHKKEKTEEKSSRPAS